MNNNNAKIRNKSFIFEFIKVKFKEIAWVMADIVNYTAEQLGKGSNEKN